MDKQNQFRSCDFHMDAGDVCHVLIKDLVGEEFDLSLNDNEGNEEDESDKWGPYFDFLWTGLVSYEGPDYLISDLPDRRKITVTGRDFGGTYIPGGSAATFTLPTDADFVADDLDHLWFVGGVQQNVTANDLVTGEYRTVVKFANAPPYDITAIGLLKHDAVFTSTLEDELAADFDLWLFWMGLINYTL